MDKLYEKFVGFISSMDDIGNALKRSQSSYEKAMNQLVEGRGNLVNQAQQLDKLGIKYNKAKQLPSDLVSRSEEEQNWIESEDNASS